MVLTDYALAESKPARCVGRIDPGMDNQTGRLDRSLGLELSGCRSSELVSLGEIATHLGDGHRPGSNGLRHLRALQAHRCSSQTRMTILEDMTPHLTSRHQASGDLVRPHLENLDEVPARLCAPVLSTTRWSSNRRHRGRRWSNEDGVDIAVCIRFGAGKRTEHNRRDRYHGKLLSDAPPFLKQHILRPRKGAQRPRGHVLGDKPEQR